MNITFANGKTFTYTNAYGMEHDYVNNIRRASLKVHMPLAQTSFAEIDEILSDVSNLTSIILTSDPEPVYVDGEIDSYDVTQNTYVDYDIKGAITVDGDEISFKLYEKSELEVQNEEAIATIDELLIALEG